MRLLPERTHAISDGDESNGKSHVEGQNVALGLGGVSTAFLWMVQYGNISCSKETLCDVYGT
jgi:hypothetical protein